MQLKQHGVRKCILYENKNIRFHYPEVTRQDLIDEVFTDGITIEIEACNRIDFDFNVSLGENSIIVYEFLLRFMYFGLTPENLAEIKRIENPNGFIAELHFQDGITKYLVPTPIKLQPFTLVGKSQVGFPLELKNIILTDKELLNVQERLLGDLILIDTSSLLLESGAKLKLIT